jgi:ABC-2 type transport system permease protein
LAAFLFTAALKEYFRIRRMAIWIIIVVALFGLAKAYLFVTPGQSTQDAYVNLTGIMVYRVLALAAAIFGTAVVAQEIEQKTIVYLVTRPIPRPTLILCRLAATAAVVFIVGFVAALSVSLAIYGGRAFSNDILWRDVPALFLGACAYSAVFVFFSLLMNRSMLINLFFTFGWELFIPNLPGDAHRLSVFSYLKAIAQRPATEDPSSPLGFFSGQVGPDVVSKQTGYVTILFIIVGAAGLAAWWFKNFEYLPREDAE